MDMSIEEAARVFTDPSAYADEPRFYAACARLRRERPVAFVDVKGHDPFWALTRYDDIMTVERAPAAWVNAPRPALGGPSRKTDEPVEMPVRTLVQMDAPDHTTYRKISVDWFKQANVARLGDRAAELAKRSVDHMAELGGECDFFRDVAMNYPLYIILALLGLPEEDFPRMLKLTQEMFGKDDPELASEEAGDRLMANLLEFFEYFQGLIDDRRAQPARRPRVGDRERRRRRRADRCPGGGRLLRDHRDGRPRHHQRRDQRRTRGAARAPRAAATPYGRPRPRAERGGGDVPVRVAGEAVHAHRHQRSGPGRRDHSRGRVGADVVPGGEPRRGRVREPGRLRRQRATRIGTSRSASVPTTASARTSPGSRPARSTTSSSRGSSTPSSPAPPSSCTPSSSAVPSTSRCATDFADRVFSRRCRSRRCRSRLAWR